MARLKIRNGNIWEDLSAITGPKGDKGDTGPTGPTGPKGDTGDVSDVIVDGVSVVTNGVAAITMPSDEIFIAEYGTTTYQEIADAYDAGKAVFMEVSDGTLAVLTKILSSSATFATTLYSTGISFMRFICLAANDTWTTSLSNTLAPLSSPAFTGTPTAPTAPDGTDTTQIATTEFVQNAVDTIVEPWSRSFTFANSITIQPGTSGILVYDLGPVTDYEDMTAVIGALPLGSGLRDGSLILSAGWLEPDYSTYSMYYKIPVFNVLNTPVIVDTSDQYKWNLTLTFIPTNPT